jgi:hypothetical protein
MWQRPAAHSRMGTSREIAQGNVTEQYMAQGLTQMCVSGTRNQNLGEEAHIHAHRSCPRCQCCQSSQPDAHRTIHPSGKSVHIWLTLACCPSMASMFPSVMGPTPIQRSFERHEVARGKDAPISSLSERVRKKTTIPGVIFDTICAPMEPPRSI